MCGIAGFVGSGSAADLKNMTDALLHRGPDGSGMFEDATLPVFLGHRRLAIVDVETGHQPMWNETHDVAVIFNGEIYNHAELRAELTTLGHRFATAHSDTEVLVHGWEEWGTDLPIRLNGMFSFAVFDRQQACMFLARDRFGEKPMYYAQGKSHFAFASELDALTQHPSVTTELNMTAVSKLFGYGYIPAPHALYDGTNKLPGGHWLRLDIRTLQSTLWAYATFALEPDESLCDADEERLVDELHALLEQAAKRRLMSDVPLGVFLSGGLDSSVVLGSLASNGRGGDYSTFTIGFTEKSFDESGYARTVADAFGTRHHLRTLNLEEARNLIPEVLNRLNEPLGDASILPTSLLASFTRENVKVALSGDGGDELFAGYDPFLALKLAERYERIMPKWGHGAARKLVDLLPISNKNMSLDFKLRRGLLGMSYDESVRIPAWMSPLEPDDISDLLQMPVRPEDVYSEAAELWNRDPSKSSIDKALEFFTTFYLQDDILTKADRASMMHSLETRAVFLDNDLVDFCRKLPHRFKLRNGERKYLLKKVARRMLSPSIVDRKKKGFGIPLAHWMKHMPTETSTARVPGLDQRVSDRAWADHRAGKADWRLFLWTWLSLQHTVSSQVKRSAA